MSKRKFEAAKEFALEHEIDIPALQKDRSAQKGKKKKNKKAKNESDLDATELVEALGDAPDSESKPWRNKQRVLIFCSRGTGTRHRHMMEDVRMLLPHSKKDVKYDSKHNLYDINEICDLKSCNNCLYFEVRKKFDCYLWVSRTPNGPSCKFYLTNVHTMLELKLMGNALKGSRPIVMFDKNFDSAPHWQLLKELFTQVFGTPKGHPDSKPFVDHMLSFFIVDNHIWFRHYQIAEVGGDGKGKGKVPQLVEIGPRFVMEPIRMFSGSFGGPTLWQSETFVSPNEERSLERKALSEKYVKRIMAKKKLDEKRKEIAESQPVDGLEDVFV